MLRKSLLAVIALCVIALAQGPRVDVGERHGNMRAAQQLIQQAWQKVDAAQHDNNYDLGGHAGRAKELLSQASEEIRLAADSANQRK
jgi:hypothetical protein